MRGSDTAIALYDYGAGNLHSLSKALTAPGVTVTIEADPKRAVDSDVHDVLVLPGVGAFTGAAERLGSARDAIRSGVDQGFPIIGICLGMQLLFDSSEEGPGRGLGLIPGVVRRLRTVRVPQIGWNTVEATAALTSDWPHLGIAYYANSYVCEPSDPTCVTAWSIYDSDRFAASVRSGRTGNIIGVQYHPEKSSAAGVAFLRGLVAGVRAELRR
jgi:glutamine amidotransferase